jgi:hypothetical protein
MIRFTAGLQIKASEGGKPRRFAILAYSGGLLPVDGFDKPVIVDLSGLEVPGAIPILIDHEKSVEATLGITDQINNDGTKITLGGQVTGQSQKAQTVLAADASGHRWQASIGARVLEQEEIPAGQTVEVNGQVFAGPVIVARRSVLRETSVLPMGADATTQVNLAAKAATLKGSAMTFEEWLASLKIDATTLTPEDMAAMQLAYESKSAAPPAMAASPAVAAPVVAPTAAAGAVVDLQASLATFRKQAADETRRIQEIQAKAAGYPMIAAKAIEDGWNTDKVELEVLKASAARTRPTSFQSAQNSPENMPQVIEAAVCMQRKISNVEKQFDDRTLQAAHSQFRRGIGLKQMVLMAAAANGANVGIATQVTDGNLRELLAYACPDSRNIQASAFTAISLPGILSNVANKEILQGYMEEDAVWREIAQIKSVSDFKTVTSYRMLDDATYEKLGPGGRMKHAKFGEESFTRAVDTYAKMAIITRQDIINDDLSAFDDMRSRIGRGGAMALNDLFWSTFLGNLATIFTTTRTNYISGSTTNLGTDGVGLGLGQKAWRQRVSPSGDGSKRVGGTAKFLLVPPELETVADALYVGRNNSSVKVSDVNTFAGKYQPICAPQLSDSTITGYSTTAWYLLGDKSMGSPVVVSFLNGQETPTVESADADFSQLGIQFRGYHDFGCNVGDGYLNALMSKGAA